MPLASDIIHLLELKSAHTLNEIRVLAIWMASGPQSSTYTNWIKRSQTKLLVDPKAACTQTEWSRVELNYWWTVRLQSHWPNWAVKLYPLSIRRYRCIQFLCTSVTVRLHQSLGSTCTTYLSQSRLSMTRWTACGWSATSLKKVYWKWKI